MAQPAFSIDRAHSVDNRRPGFDTREAVSLPEAPTILSSTGATTIDWNASPARLLHERLMAAYGEQPARTADDDRLPLATRLLIVCIATLVPWAAIAAILIALP